MVNRRSFCLSSLTAVTYAAPSFAAAYPERPIKMIVGFPAGQSSDTSARLIAQGMQELLKQPVVVDNRPGAAGIISHEAVKNAAADGYTLLLGSTGTLSINPSLYRKLPYEPLRDFEPVAAVSASPLALFVSVSSPLSNLKDLVAFARLRPGKVTYGSSGSGTTGHIAMEMLKKEAGIELLHVPYKGSPSMMTDIISGQVDVAFDTVGSVLSMTKGGRVKLLGIAALKRFAAMPAVPTLAEQGLADFEAVPWSAILAPSGTPPAIVAKLNEAVNAALNNTAVLELFNSNGSMALPGSAQDLRVRMLKEQKFWSRAVALSGAQAD